MKRIYRYHVNEKAVERQYNYIPFRYILAKCIEIIPDMLKTSLSQRLVRAVVRIFAPML